MSSMKDAIRDASVVEQRRKKKSPVYQGSFISKILESERVDMQYGHANYINPTGVVSKFQAGYFRLRNRLR